MSWFERCLTFWVALCIFAGIALGHFMPGLPGSVAAAEIARVNIPVAVLVWLMIIPMLVKIDFRALGGVASHCGGIGITLVDNWAVEQAR